MEEKKEKCQDKADDILLVVCNERGKKLKKDRDSVILRVCECVCKMKRISWNGDG